MSIAVSNEVGISLPTPTSAASKPRRLDPNGIDPSAMVMRSTPCADPPPALPKRKVVHVVMEGALSAAMIAAGILSVIPPLRFAGALALRSISLLSCLAMDPQIIKQSDWKQRLATFAKIAIITVGLIGIAVAMPALVVASLVADLALQIFECIKAFNQKNISKGATHLAMIVIDAFALGAILWGVSGMMLAAGVVSGVIGAGVLILSATPEDDAAWRKTTLHRISMAIRIVSGVALMGIALAAGIEATSMNRKYNHYTVTNDDSRGNKIVYDQNGTVIEVVHPGQTRSFNLEAFGRNSDLYTNSYPDYRIQSDYSYYTEIRPPSVMPNEYYLSAVQAPALHPHERGHEEDVLFNDETSYEKWKAKKQTKKKNNIKKWSAQVIPIVDKLVNKTIKEPSQTLTPDIGNHILSFLKTQPAPKKDSTTP